MYVKNKTNFSVAVVVRCCVTLLFSGHKYFYITTTHQNGDKDMLWS